MEEKNKSICPVCHSWNRETDEEYDVKYEKQKIGMVGVCLNPICRAKLIIKPSNDFSIILGK